MLAGRRQPREWGKSGRTLFSVNLGYFDQTPLRGAILTRSPVYVTQENIQLRICVSGALI